MKAILNAILILVVSFAALPGFSGTAAVLQDETAGHSIVTDETAGGKPSIDEKMLLEPSGGCDPKMLILPESGFDPAFLLTP